MRLLPALVSLALWPLVLASSSAQSNVAKLAANNKGLVRLNGPLYDELIAAPRNYSATVLLTALGSQFGCRPCKMFDPEYKAVARTWQKQPHKDGDHFFAVLDFDDSMDTFRRVQRSSLRYELWLMCL
jgi:oligosaccharyltransferase complex subunit gamma